jgi:hypothetical protein
MTEKRIRDETFITNAGNSLDAKEEFAEGCFG